MEITPKDAKCAHNITTFHTDENDQLRFRLLKNHVGYIRSEAKKNLWESSHYHKYITEIYIIQEGTVILAKLNDDGRIVICKYAKGDIFTIKPNIVHKLYLNKGTEMHVVKYGNPQYDDKEDNDAKCNKFEEYIGPFCVDIKLLEMLSIEEKEVESPKYSDDYKHFDKLIWQAPVWTTALFIGSFAFLFRDIQQSKLFPNINWITGYCIMFIAVVVTLLSYVLYRFRVRQAPLGRGDSVNWWKSGATYMQLIVNIEASLLYYIGNIVIHSNNILPIILSLIIFISTSSYYIIKIREEKKQSAPELIKCISI